MLGDSVGVIGHGHKAFVTFLGFALTLLDGGHVLDEREPADDLAIEVPERRRIHDDVVLPARGSLTRCLLTENAGVFVHALVQDGLLGGIAVDELAEGHADVVLRLAGLLEEVQFLLVHEGNRFVEVGNDAGNG